MCYSVEKIVNEIAVLTRVEIKIDCLNSTKVFLYD